MKKKTIYDIGLIDDFVIGLEKHLDKPVTIYMIGGGAMCLRGLKDATFDIDFVVETKNDFDILFNALNKFGFNVLDTKLMNENVYRKAPAVFEKGESRIDIFIKSIVGMLDFSKNMITRSELHKKSGKLKLMLASNTDIFILKNLAGRDKDITDIEMLLKSGVKWSSVIDECDKQSREGASWIFFVYENLCKVENTLGIEIDGKQRVFRACREIWDKKPDDFMREIKNLGNHLSGKFLKDVKDSFEFL
jgi:hypothetical protein